MASTKATTQNTTSTNSTSIWPRLKNIANPIKAQNEAWVDTNNPTLNTQISRATKFNMKFQTPSKFTQQDKNQILWKNENREKLRQPPSHKFIH